MTETVKVALVVMALRLGGLGVLFACVFAVALGVPFLVPVLVAGLIVFLIARATHREHRRIVAYPSAVRVTQPSNPEAKSRGRSRHSGIGRNARWADRPQK